MTTFPLDEWQARAKTVESRLYPSTGRSRLAANAMAELEPELAELVQVIARGRSYGDPNSKPGLARHCDLCASGEATAYRDAFGPGRNGHAHEGHPNCRESEL